MHTNTSFFSTSAGALCILALGLALRLILAGQVLLAPDETNYWQWSRYLALGYHDHPPMIAWLIHLSTLAFGHTEFAVRLPTIIGITVASLYLSLLAARWFGWACAAQLALASQLILLFNGAALIATPDGLLLGCWAAACYHAAVAVERQSPQHWLLTGFWFGLGMLSKYTMLLFLPCLFFFLLFSSRYRGSLLTPWPWLGVLLSTLLFTPVLVWNADNEWTTFRHVLFQGGMGKKTWFTLRYIGDFLLTQLLLFTPVFALLLFRAWLHPRSPAIANRDQRAFLLWMSALVFALFALLSLHVRIYGNWPAPAYCTALVLLAALYAPTAGRSGRAWWNAGLLTAAVCTVPILIQAVIPILPLPASLDRIARETTGWRDLGETVQANHAQMARPDRTFIFALRYQWASELAFYVPGQPKTVSINRWTRPNVYDFWFDDDMLLGQDGIGIYEWKGMDSYLATLFEHTDPPEEIRLYRQSPWFGRQHIHTFYLFRGYGFKGGLRWQPPDQSDIRATRRQGGS